MSSAKNNSNNTNRLPLSTRAFLVLFRVRFALLILSVTALAAILPYASNGTVVVLVCLFLALFGSAPFWQKLNALLVSPLGLSFAALCGLMALSSLWAPDPQYAICVSLRFLALGAMGLVLYAHIDGLPAALISKVKTLLVYTVIATLLFYAVDIASGAKLASLVKGWEQKDLNRISRGATIMALLVWPAAYIIYTRHKSLRRAGLLVAGCFAVMAGLAQGAGFLGFILSIIVFAIVYKLGRNGVIVVTTMFFATAALAPVLSTYVVNLEHFGPKSPPYEITSWQHRLGIWEFTAGEIMKRPLVGHGVGAARTQGAKKQEMIMNPAAPEAQQTQREVMPLHPHNGALQIWYELGAIGFIVFAGLLVAATRAMADINNADKAQTATRAAMFAHAFTVFGLSFGVWQNWWIAGLWLCLLYLKMATSNGQMDFLLPPKSNT